MKVGIKKIMVLRANQCNDFSSYPENTPIGMAALSSEAPIELPNIISEVDFSVQTSRTASGKLVSTSISGTFRREARKEHFMKYSRLSGVPLIFIIELLTGEKRKIGDKGFPAFIEISESINMYSSENVSFTITNHSNKGYSLIQ